MRGLLTIAAAVAAAFLATGSVVAGGCCSACAAVGFKFVPFFDPGDPDIFDISIPCCNGYNLLSEVFNDINAAAGCSAAQVTHFFPDQSSCSWTGPFTCDRTVECLESLRISTNGTCAGWVVVGAACVGPAIACRPTLGGATFPTADPDIYHLSVPYHTTAQDMEDLFNEIPNCAQVTRFHSDQSSCSWTGAFTCNELVDLQQGWRFSVTAAPTTWVPSHY